MSKLNKKRGIWDLGKTTEIPKFPAQRKEKNKQGICGDEKNLLKDEGRKKSCQRIKPVTAKMLIESIGKDRGNEFLNVKMLIEKLK